jgi:hypothetical protein
MSLLHAAVFSVFLLLSLSREGETHRVGKQQWNQISIFLNLDKLLD